MMAVKGGEWSAWLSTLELCLGHPSFGTSCGLFHTRQKNGCDASCAKLLEATDLPGLSSFVGHRHALSWLSVRVAILDLVSCASVRPLTWTMPDTRVPMPGHGHASAPHFSNRSRQLRKPPATDGPRVEGDAARGDARRQRHHHSEEVSAAALGGGGDHCCGMRIGSLAVGCHWLATASSLMPA